MPRMTIGNSDFFYEDQGKGLPIVLVHGFPLDGRIFEGQLLALAGRFRVIVPDLPGFGQSKSRATFTMKSLADDLRGLLQGLGALPCVLGGLSMGGYVIQAYYRKYPADLRGFVLLDTKAEADSTDAKANRRKMADLARREGARPTADQMLPKMLHPSAYTARPDLVAMARQIMEACLPETIANASLAMCDREDFTAELASVAVPTLLIFGDGDAISPPSIGQFMKSQIPHAELALIAGAGHLSSIEQPQVVADALRAFCEKLR